MIFYHAAGHLDTALAAAYGDTHPKRRAQFEKQRHVLLEDYKGVEKVIRSLVHLRDSRIRAEARELKYFRRNRSALRGAQGTRSADRFRRRSSVQDSSEHEEVMECDGASKTRSFVPEQSLRVDPARTYLQGGGYDSRQCRADTQLAMIGVSMRVTPQTKDGAEEASATQDGRASTLDLPAGEGREVRGVSDRRIGRADGRRAPSARQRPVD